jgi:hypothetical protein
LASAAVADEDETPEAMMARIEAEGGYETTEDGSREQMGFDKDLPGEALLSADELTDKHFSDTDENGDGFIDYAEVTKRFRGHMDSRHKKMIKFHDDGTKQQFKQMDSDSSGSLVRMNIVYSQPAF